MKKEISKGNEIISNFMGFEKVRIGYLGTKSETKWQLKHEKWLEKNDIDNVGTYIVNVKKNKCIGWDSVAYHKSWDWLMPVVEEIEELGYHFKWSEDSIGFMHHATRIFQPFTYKLHGNRINTTWMAVVEFIKLHPEFELKTK